MFLKEGSRLDATNPRRDRRSLLKKGTGSELMADHAAKKRPRRGHVEPPVALPWEVRGRCGFALTPVRPGLVRSSFCQGILSALPFVCVETS